MRINSYAVANLIFFGIVILEVSVQIVLCCLNKQATRSFYFKFLLLTALWTLLRCVLSFPAIYENVKLSMCILNLIYPCIVDSFLLLTSHYIRTHFESQKRKAKLSSWIWEGFIIFEFFLFIVFFLILWIIELCMACMDKIQWQFASTYSWNHWDGTAFPCCYCAARTAHLAAYFC